MSEDRWLQKVVEVKDAALLAAIHTGWCMAHGPTGGELQRADLHVYLRWGQSNSRLIQQASMHSPWNIRVVCLLWPGPSSITGSPMTK